MATDFARRKAVDRYRDRLAERGLRRFEVVAPAGDVDLLRSLARRLSEPGPDAAVARDAARSLISPPSETSGGVLSALRRSPLVGADVDFTRARPADRSLDL